MRTLISSESLRFASAHENPRLALAVVQTMHRMVYGARSDPMLRENVDNTINAILVDIYTDGAGEGALTPEERESLDGIHLFGPTAKAILFRTKSWKGSNDEKIEEFVHLLIGEFYKREKDEDGYETGDITKGAKNLRIKMRDLMRDITSGKNRASPGSLGDAFVSVWGTNTPKGFVNNRLNNLVTNTGPGSVGERTRRKLELSMHGGGGSGGGGDNDTGIGIEHNLRAPGVSRGRGGHPGGDIVISEEMKNDLNKCIKEEVRSAISESGGNAQRKVDIFDAMCGLGFLQGKEVPGTVNKMVKDPKTGEMKSKRVQVKKPYVPGQVEVSDSMCGSVGASTVNAEMKSILDVVTPILGFSGDGRDYVKMDKSRSDCYERIMNKYMDIHASRRIASAYAGVDG